MTDLAAAWTALETAARTDSATRIVDLFAAEPDRLARLSVEVAGLTLDLSKQPWSAGGLTAALDLARAAGVEARRDRQFAGEVLNVTENRAVLHMALRAPDGADWQAVGKPVSAGVEAVRGAMAAFVADVREAKGPNVIFRENSQRRFTVAIKPTARDVGVLNCERALHLPLHLDDLTLKRHNLLTNLAQVARQRVRLDGLEHVLGRTV